MFKTTKNTTPTTRGQYLITLEITHAYFDARFFFLFFQRQIATLGVASLTSENNLSQCHSDLVKVGN